MSLRDYDVQRDRFQPDVRHSGLDFPCCACVHRDKRADEEPCNHCDHNANAEPDPKKP